MADELLAFLLARLDEDEALARVCDADEDCGRWLPAGSTVECCDGDIEALVPVTAEHIARYDPTRALREVNAKRGVVTALGATGRHSKSARAALLHLAAVYRDHPQWCTEWNPELLGTAERRGGQRTGDT